MSENARYNSISFGFEQGEASSKFVAAVGQTFYAPVTLSLLPGQKIYTLQFNLSATSADPGTPEIAVSFESKLMKPIEGSNPVLYTRIDPQMFFFDPTTGLTGLTNLLMTNTAFNQLLVGWIERAGNTNLYDSTKQDLITYSIVHDNMFSGSAGKVIAGGFAFTVPPTAKLNDTYQLRIGRPSATYDGVSGDVFIDTPNNGSLAEGAINATKVVTVGSPEYIVGDVAPFRWFNAGDFGDTNLLNNDVVQVFQSAVYNMNTPPGKSDFFNAMDASDGTLTAVQDGNDKSIDNVRMGDGVLAVDDVFVVYRRSLDPTLKWYARYRDASGVLNSKEVPNLFRGRPMLPAETVVRARATAVSNDPPSVSFYADDFQVAPGQPVEVPVRVKVLGNWPLRVLMLNVAVRPLDNSPALTQPVQFIPDPALGKPFATSSQGPNYAAVWLNTSVDGVLGQGVIGTLKFTVPASADADAAYRIEFDHASASPNGLAIFPQRLQAGLATLRNRMISSRGDGIPDAWRLRFFGSVTNRLAEAMADADGDGMPNWAEFRAGTNPADFRSLLRMLACGVKADLNNPQQPLSPVLRWPSIEGKKYILEASPALAGPQWNPVSSEILGTGGDMEYTDTQADGRVRFYRVRVAAE